MNRVLTLSIVGNVILLLVVGLLLFRHGPLQKDAVGSEPIRPISGTISTDQNVAKTPLGAPTQDGLFREALVNLEKVGLSRRAVVNAFLEEFHVRWNQRYEELQKRYAPRRVPERAYIDLGRQRDEAQELALKGLLGEDGYREWRKVNLLENLNPGGILLSPEEEERAFLAQRNFEEEYEELRKAMEDGVADIADVTALQNSARDKLNQDLETLLGAERLASMRGLSDPVDDVVQRLGDLNPSRVQAEAVVRLEAEHESMEAAVVERLKALGPEGVNPTEELKAIDAAREAEMRRIFGNEAYEKTLRQNDPTFQTLERYAGAWNLSGPEIEAVYSSLNAWQKEARFAQNAARLKASSGQSVDWAEVEKSVERLRGPTEAQLLSLVGAERFKRLKSNGLLSVR